jgi:amino-acid N-acetyltransferase
MTHHATVHLKHIMLLFQGARIPGNAVSPSLTSSSTSSSTSDAPIENQTINHSIPDALAADVANLELVSYCQADIDNSPSIMHSDYDPIQTLHECSIPSDWPFVSILRDSSPYIVNHRQSTIVYHIPGELLSDSQKFFSVIDDIALTWLFGMKIVISVGCRRQIVQRLERLHGTADSEAMPGVRVTSPETLRILEEEAGFCRFEVERLLNRCLRNKGADCNVVSGCFITAKKFGVVDGVDYMQTGYPTNVQVDKIRRLHSRNDVVLITPLGFTKDGDALNVHSEQLAAFTAAALQASKVVYFSSHPMVLRGSGNRNSGAERIQMIQRSNANSILSHYGLHVNSATGFPSWKEHQDSRGNAVKRAHKLNYHQQSMLLKMGWATHALEKGVERAHIIDCEDGSLLDELFSARRGYGTCISQDDYEAPHPEDWNDDLTLADIASSTL